MVMNPALPLLDASTAARMQSEERPEATVPNAQRMMAARYLGVKIPQAQAASRDGYGWHPLHGGRALCAWVADAPDDARVDTPDLIHHAVRRFLYSDQETERVIAAVASPEEARVILADLVTSVGDALLEAACQHRQPCHAAAVFLLATAQGLHFITVGDCAAFVFLHAPDAIYRLSGTTRVGSSLRLDLLPGLGQPEHYQEAGYLGAQRQLAHPADVISLPLRGTPRIALMSDGPERQVSCAELLLTLRDLEMGSADAQEALEGFLSAQPPVDDLTLLTFDAALVGLTTPAEEAGTRLEEKVPAAEPSLSPRLGIGPGISALIFVILIIVLGLQLFILWSQLLA
jgi:hypothetical protein